MLFSTSCLSQASSLRTKAWPFENRTPRRLRRWEVRDLHKIGCVRGSSPNFTTRNELKQRKTPAGTNFDPRTAIGKTEGRGFYPNLGGLP